MTFPLIADKILIEAKAVAAQYRRRPDWAMSKDAILERFKDELSGARMKTRGEVREYAKYLKELIGVFG